jgi:hypothetical protein
MADINNSIQDLNNPGTPDFSPEVIESQLRSINSYIDKNLPLVLEGLNDAEVSYEKRFQDLNSVMPNSKAPDIRDIQTNIAGDSLIRPGLDLKRVDDDGTQSYVDSLSSKLSTDIATTPDPYKYARPTSFNASRFGSNYERYYASDDAFKKLGFNVYRDNESLYNANNTWWDDFSRMGSKYMGLFGGAFTGMFSNWGKFGAIGSAEEAAKMENDLSIATSTKEGFGAWTTNFLANTAYTVGTVAELALENFLIASAAAATRNPALIAVAGGRNAMKLRQMQKSLSTMAKTMRDPAKAKSFWTAAKGLGHNALPMSEFRSFAADALNPNSAFHRVSNMAKAGRGFGSFYRGMAEINAVTAEARLEGGFVQNKVAQESYNAFIKKNGRNPTAEESEEIYNNALEAGARTTMLNVPAIYFSNKVVLDTAFRSFKPLSRLLDKQAMKSPFYKVIENVNWKKAGKDPYEVIKKGSLLDKDKKIFSADALKNIPSRLTDFSTQSFKKTAGNTIRYFNANLMEGMQELYQEGLQEGVSSYYLENYYANLYQDPLRAANNTVLRAMSDGVMSQLSSQGLDVFLSGFLMGGVLQPVQSGFASLSLSSMRIGDYINKTDEYTKYQDQEKERVDKYVQTLNDVTKNPQAYAKWIDENLKLQRDMAVEYNRAEQSGDRKPAEDAKQDSLFSHVYTLAATGKLSILEDQLADLKNLSPEELAEAFGETHEDTPDFNSNMRMRLDNVVKKVEQVKKRYERASSIRNPFNPDYFSEQKDPVNYNKEKIGYESFEKAKMMFAFNEYTLDRSLDRIESLIREASTEGPLGQVAASDFSILYSSRPTKEQFIRSLASEIQAYQDGTKEGEAKVKRLKAQLEGVLETDNAASNYKAIHKLIEKAKTSPKAAEELKKIAQDIKGNVELVDESTGQMIMDFEQADVAADVVVNEYYKELVKDSYDKYVKTIAENSDVYVGQFDSNESFNKLIDFLRLDSDAQNSSDIINTLADPLSVLRMAEKIQAASEKVNARMEELHRKAVEEFTNKMQSDEFLQQLLEMGVYFKPEYIESYFEKDELPKEFLDVLDNSTIKEGDEKYQQIVDLITKIEQLRGKTFSGKPAPVRAKPKPPAPAPVTPAPAGTSTAPTPAATPGTSAEDLPEQDDEDPLSIYSESVANRLLAEFEKKFPDPATRPGNIMDWILESPIAAKIINGVGDSKLNVDLSTITDLITADNPKSIVTAVGPVADLYKNQFALSDSRDGYVGVINDARVTAKRVSSLLPKDIKADTRFSRKRGDFMDLVLRSFSTPGTEGLSPKDYLLNAIQVYNKTQDATNLDAAKEAIKEMIGRIANQFSNDTEFPINFTDGSIDDFANALEDLAILLKDYTWYPAIPAMGGMIRNELYAGQIDLLLEKDGKFYLVDIKTSMSPRRGLKEYYETSDLVQQNAYAELMRQNSMIDVDGIFILNFITNENKDKKVLNGIQLDYRVKTDGKESVFYDVPKQPIEEILNRILGPLETKPGEAPAPAPVPTDAKVDIEAKKADIQRRKKELLVKLDKAEKDFKEKVTDVYDNLEKKGIKKSDKFLGKDELERTERFWRNNLFQVKRNLQILDDELNLLIDENNPNSEKIGNISKLKQDLILKRIKDRYVLESDFDNYTPDEIANLLKDVSIEYLDKIVLQKGYSGDALQKWFKKGRDAKYNAELKASKDKLSVSTDAKAEIEKLEKELFEKNISLENWTSVEHGKYVTLLDLRGDVEKRDLLRNLEPSASWQLYAIETLSEKEAEEVLKGIQQIGTDAKADIEKIQNSWYNELRNTLSPGPRTLPNIYLEFPISMGGKKTRILLNRNDRKTVTIETDNKRTGNNSAINDLYSPNAPTPDVYETKTFNTTQEAVEYMLERAGISSDPKQQDLVNKAKEINDRFTKQLAALEGKPVGGTEEVSEKVNAPTRFKGKLIYAEPGSVDPSVFRQYDVVNADEVLAAIGREMGVTPEAGETIYKAIYNSPRSEDIYTEFRNRVNDLTKSGNTVITSSFTLRDLADVRSTPARDEFKFFNDATSEQESLKMFDTWVNQNSTRKSEYDAAQEEGWESVVQPIKKGQPAFEANTNKTVKELFEISQLPSTFVYKMQTASSLTTLRNLAAIYFSDPTNKKKFYNVTPEGKRVLLEPAQVKALYNKRVDQLFKNARELNAEDVGIAKEFFSNLMTEAQIVEQPTTMTEEDKQSAEAAVKESSLTDLAAVAKQAIADARNSTVEEVNNDFFNNLDCE